MGTRAMLAASGRPETNGEFSQQEFANYAHSLLHSLQRIAIVRGEKALSVSLERAKQECVFISETN